MLIETRRKRGRAAIGAFTATDTLRWRRASGGAPGVEESEGVASTQRRGLAGSSSTSTTTLVRASPSTPTTPVILSTLPPHMVATSTPSSSSSTDGAVISSSASSSSSSSFAVDRRMLLSRASRMQLLVLDRLRSLDLRRGRRCELLEEIMRLKKTIQELQEQMDATTRSVESMERLVLHLQRLSSFCGDSTTTTTAAAPTTRALQLENNSSGREATLQRADDALVAERSYAYNKKGHERPAREATVNTTTSVTDER